jgi:2,4-dienoyl-CoA reductase (NADPH2)
MKYPHLFQSCVVGGLELKNRIVMPPMTTNYTRGGFITDRLLDFYEERARGGAGLIIAEDAIVEAPRGKHTLRDVYINDDNCIPGLQRLAQTIKDNGARAAIHLSHSGRNGGRLREGKLLLTGNHTPVAPSALAYPAAGFAVPQELTVEDIIDIEHKFANAAHRAKEAGFEAIMLHCSHGYLIEQFLSPFSNKREDDYGGDLNRRFRFLKETIARIKQKVGNQFPLLCRISGRELWEGGLTIENAMENAQKLQDCGVHGISVSIGSGMTGFNYKSFLPVSASPLRGGHGALVYLAEAIKSVLSIPVIASNGLNDPDLAELVLQQGKADLIAVGRGLIADPEWPKKLSEERVNKIRPCICCNQCFMGGTGNPLTCATNPVAGREKELCIYPASKTKTVLIAGAGPAGMEAARVARLRGHRVRLYEKNKLGGKLNLAYRPPGKEDIRKLIDFQLEQIHELGVEIVNKEVTPAIVIHEKADAVIVATGASWKIQEFPDYTTANILDVRGAFNGNITQRKIAVIGGGQIGAETAEYLASRGNEVTIIEKSKKIAADVAHQAWFYDFLIVSLNSLGVNMLTEAKIEGLTEKGVSVIHDERHLTVEADVVVIATGNKANRKLIDQLESMAIEIYPAGDCAGSGKILKAVKEGFLAGLSV